MSATAEELLGMIEAETKHLGEGKNVIKKVSYSHDAMIDLIVEQPGISQGRIAAYFGYTEGWVSQIIHADAFQSRLAERKDALVDPALKLKVEERLNGLIAKSIAVLQEKLAKPSVSDQLVLGALNIATKAAGYGARTNQTQVNVNFVAQVPAKSASSKDWENANRVIDVTPAPFAAAFVESLAGESSGG